MGGKQSFWQNIKDVKPYIEIVLVTVGIAVSIWVGYSANQIAESANKTAEETLQMSELTQPIVYTIAHSEDDTEYGISSEGVEIMTMTAKEPNIIIQNGALKAAAVIGFDGENLSFIETFDEELAEKDDTLKIRRQVAAVRISEDGKVAYDYWFLYLEPVDGAPTLDLVCTELDLVNQVAREPYVLQKLNLLELTFPISLGLDEEWASDSPQTLGSDRQHMLETYQKLLASLAEIPSLGNLSN